MQFQRLRLVGFKSFVDPAEVHIESGLTGVVGPNGCGKSNVLESLRWVMGANSAKAMRGQGMDDVIFAGAAGRPPRSHAAVSLTIDNAQRRAPQPLPMEMFGQKGGFILYRTKLIGFDQDWVDRGSQHVAEYTNLQPGSYQFLVSAAYPESDWNTEVARVEFTVLPLFWQKGWVQLSAAVLVLLLLFGFVRWRLYRLSQSELKLKLQVASKTGCMDSTAPAKLIALNF